MSDIAVDCAADPSMCGDVTDRLHTAACTSEEASTLPRSLFEGVPAAACAALGVASLRHRSTLNALGRKQAAPPGAVAAVYDRVAANLARARGNGVISRSRETWRWSKPQTHISEDNTSPEVRLERGIVQACVRAEHQDWSNQVPVASGLVGPSADRRCAIDLVHQVGQRWFEFIELKVASDTPLSAAVEIIGYACAWLLARKDAGEALAAPDLSLLLQADRIDLVVLAPTSYYAPFNLGPLQSALDGELKALGRAHGVKLSFAFQTLADGLCGPELPPDDALLDLLDRRRPL